MVRISTEELLGIDVVVAPLFKISIASRKLQRLGGDRVSELAPNDMLSLLEDNLGASGEPRTKLHGLRCSGLHERGRALLQSAHDAPVLLVLRDGEEYEIRDARADVDDGADGRHAGYDFDELCGFDVGRPQVIE